MTDTQGHYELAFLPLGPSPIIVREAAARGIGFGSVTLDQQGETKTVDITLFAQGTLVVTVQTANGALVPNASVRVSAGADAASDTLFATTGSDGSVVVNHVILGDFSVRADSGNVTGFTPGNLAANDQKAVLVVLQPTASIGGIVRAPNGAPVSGGTVEIGGTATGALVSILSDGTFRADNLVFGSYLLTARDAQGRIRARVTDPVVLSSPDQVAETSMTFVGLGRVEGRVINPGGSSAAGLSVQVRSLNPDFGGFLPSSLTNAGGVYAATDIPIGNFTVSVTNLVLHLRGEATGTIQQDGAAPTVDILLQNNLIDLPLTKWDANDFVFDVQTDGSILHGTRDVFTSLYAGATVGGLQLDVMTVGTATRFTGASIATVEDQNREIAIQQDNLAGLRVTRKVFVPSTGYFARYLEILTNPSEASITADVRVTVGIQANLSGTDPASVIATSSGDDQLDVANPSTRDRWVVIDDPQPGDPFLGPGLPATAFIFDGSTGARAVSSATFAPPDSQIPTGRRELTYRWNTITIPPGGSVALMHFAVQQTTRPAAQASAERLLQLPPEALAGLSAEELALIQNFAAPSDGVSSLAPLASLAGTITGRALASDASIPAAGVPIRFQSGNILFGRTYQTTTATDGSFSFASALTDNGTSRAIPVEGFILHADHPSLGAQAGSPLAAGLFPVGLQTAQQDVVFSNTGLSRGLVRLNGVPVAGATVTASAPYGNGIVNFSTQTSSNGSYAFTLLPPGLYTFTATSTQQGGTVQANSVATVAAGQTSVNDIGIDTIAPQVSIASPAAGAPVDPRNALAVSVHAIDTGGVVQLSFAASGVATAAETRVIAPAVVARTETFNVPFEVLPPTGGTLTVTATARDGAGNQASSAPVTVTVRDVVSPDVVLVTPSAGLVGVEPDVSVTVRFSEAVDRASVTAASLRLTRGGTLVPTTLNFSDGDRTVALVQPPLPLNTTFTIEATTQIRDRAGNGLSAALASTFKTRSPDTIPPRVSAVAPANNAVNVSIGTDIRVTLTEPIDIATITPQSFRVSVGGAAVAGHFTFADNNATVRFAPDAPLPFDAIGVTELTAAITDLFQNPLVDATGQSLTTPLTFTFLTGTFGITSPAQGSEVLENAPLTLEAKASASLNVATITFSVNGQVLPTVPGPPFATAYNVSPAATTPTLTIVATGRDDAGSQIAQDEVVVTVLAGLRTRLRVLGVPLGGTGILRLGLPTPLATDLALQLTVVDSSIVTVPSASAVLAAGQTEVIVPVTGLSTGATTVAVTSARGNTWAVVSVSPPLVKTVSSDAGPVGVVVVPSRLLGQVFMPVNGHHTVAVPILAGPAGADTPVAITSTNGAIASVPDAVVIAQGAKVATIAIATGDAGTATLTLRAGNESVQLSVVVGTPPPGTVPPILAAPVGIVLIPTPSVGRLFTAPAVHSTFGVTLLPSPAAADTPVTISTSDASVASVSGSVVIPGGGRAASVTIVTGVRGSATLTLRAGAETRELTIVVGPPAPGTVPQVFANPVGVVLLQERRLGTLFTSIGGQPSVNLILLSSPAGSPIPVTVSTTDPNVASVSGTPIVPSGGQIAALNIVTGIQGVATLTLRAGSDVVQIVVVVGTPPAALVPVITAPIVGVGVNQ